MNYKHLVSMKTCSEKRRKHTLRVIRARKLSIFFLLLILSISILVFLKFLSFAKQPFVLIPGELFAIQRDSEKKLSNVHIIDLTLASLNQKFSYYHIKLQHYKFACFFQCRLFSALSQFISTAIMSKI